MTDLAGVGTRLYDSPVRHCLFGLNSMATLRTTWPNCRFSSSAAFRAQLTGERDRPLCSNETSDLRQNWTLCDHPGVTIGLLPFVSRLSCWAWNHAGVYTCMHMASRTSIVAAVSKYGEHAWDYVIISWRHNLGATFLYFMFAKCSVFHERWRLCHFQNL